MLLNMQKENRLICLYIHPLGDTRELGGREKQLYIEPYISALAFWVWDLGGLEEAIDPPPPSPTPIPNPAAAPRPRPGSLEL